MIIRNFHLIRCIITPNKADAVLLIDADAMLSSTVATEQFQLIARRQSQFRQ